MKIDSNQIQSFFQQPQPNNDIIIRAASKVQDDASLRVDYASLIDIAVQIPEANGTAVQRAKELLVSGELESPENIRAAAENITTFGI